MKSTIKLSISLVICIGTIVFLFSCEKHDNLQDHFASELDIKNLIQAPTDEETNFNLQLFNTALLFESHFMDVELRKGLLARSRMLNKTDILLDELLASNYKSDVGFSNSFREVENKLIFQGEDYSGSIYIPNINNCNPEQSPIFAIGCEVLDEDYNDLIAGWYYDNTGEKITLLISEEYAMSCKKP